MGSWANYILRKYWDRLQMVACAGGYYGRCLRVTGDVTQGDPLSPAVFDIVLDAVVCNWIMLVAGGARGKYR